MSAIEKQGTMDFETMNGLGTQLDNIRTKNSVGILNKNEVALVIDIGQSNRDGRAVIAQSPKLGAHVFTGNTKIFQKSVTRLPSGVTVNRTGDGEWTDVDFDNLQVVSPAGVNGFGPELPFIVRWEESYPDTPLYIIKLGVGGTTLANNGTIDDNWSSENDALWNLLVEYMVKPAILQLLADNKKPRLLGVRWTQGEADAQDETYADAYETNLTNLVNRIINDLGFNNPKILISGLSAYEFPYGDVVRTAQNNVADSFSNVSIVTMDGTENELAYSLFPTGVGGSDGHLTSNGLTMLAEKEFELLDFENGEYSSINDYEFIASFDGYTEKLNKNNLKYTGYNKTIAINDYPIDIGTKTSLTWVISDTDEQRPLNNSKPDPTFSIVDMDNSDDVEIIFSMYYPSEASLRPSVWLRASNLDSEDSNDFTGYQMQFRTGGTVVLINANNGLTGIATNTKSAIADALYYHKITMIGTTYTYYDSPDGIVWTEILSITNSTHTSGKVAFSLFNGLLNNTTVIPNSAKVHFPMIVTHNL